MSFALTLLHVISFPTHRSHVAFKFCASYPNDGKKSFRIRGLRKRKAGSLFLRMINDVHTIAHVSTMVFSDWTRGNRPRPTPHQLYAAIHCVNSIKTGVSMLRHFSPRPSLNRDFSMSAEVGCRTIVMHKNGGWPITEKGGRIYCYR